MQERRYLLHIGHMLEESGGKQIFQGAFDRIDGERRRKALSLKSIRARAACVGAGLLIQKALADGREDSQELPQEKLPPDGRLQGSGLAGQGRSLKLQRFTVEELLSSLGGNVVEPCYQYGENGKPYLREHPFYFNLSHSGDYVFCGVSGQEIGVDIQRIQGENELRLAKRFFSASEYRILENCGNRETRRMLFFRMWTRKEAYGKLTGRGLAEAVGKNLWPAGSEKEGSRTDGGSAGGPESLIMEQDGLLWEEYALPEGYRTAVCRRKNA